MAKSIPWQVRALNRIAEGLYLDHNKVTGEEIRFWLRSKRLKAPAHPNAYGALIRRAVDTGLLKRTKKVAASLTPTSHGRVRPVYSVVKPRKSKAAV